MKKFPISGYTLIASVLSFVATSSFADLTVLELGPGNKTLPLMPLFQDARKSVPIESARAMPGVQIKDLFANNLKILHGAMKELQESMLAKADFPERQMVLGGVALTFKSYNAASQAFKLAVTMDPQLDRLLGKFNSNSSGSCRYKPAEKAFKEALQNNPDSSEIEQLAASMGSQFKRNSCFLKYA